MSVVDPFATPGLWVVQTASGAGHLIDSRDPDTPVTVTRLTDVGGATATSPPPAPCCNAPSGATLTSTFVRRPTVPRYPNRGTRTSPSDQPSSKVADPGTYAPRRPTGGSSSCRCAWAKRVAARRKMAFSWSSSRSLPQSAGLGQPTAVTLGR